MNEKEFKKIISDKIQQLRKENKYFMHHGNKTGLINNCNQLKGIDFVMQRFKQIRFIEIPKK